MTKKPRVTKKLKRYQEGDEVKSAPATTTSAPAPRTFADTYKANIDAGMRPGQARRIAKSELGLKGPKVDPNAVINAVGNVGSAAINTFGNRGGGSSTPMDFQRKGGVKRMQSGGPMNSNKYVSNKTNMFGKLKHKDISEKKFNRVSDRYSNQEGSKTLGTDTSASQQIISGKNSNKSVSRIDPEKMAKNRKGMKFKTGGMVNANKKVAASRVATGNTGGVSKAISKVAVKAASPKGRVGGISKAPTKALPKAQLGAIIKTAKTVGKAVNKISKAPGGRTVVGGAVASGIAGLNKIGAPGTAKSSAKGMASKVASKANKQKMGGMMKRKSC